MHSGIIENQLGRAAEANIALNRARDLLDELCREQPGALELRALLARCCLEIEEVERLNEFEARYIKGVMVNASVPAAEALVAAEPDDREYLLLLGRSYDSDGLRRIRWWPDSHPEAESMLRRAVATLERAREGAPEDIEAGRRLALAHAHLGLVHQQAGRNAARVASVQRALAIFRGLGPRYQRGRQFRLDCAGCLIDLGNARIDRGRYSEAEDCLTEAGRHLDELDRADERTAEVRHGLAAVREGLGRIALARGRMAAAERAWRQAVAYFDGTSPASLVGRDLLLLGRSYLWLGRAAVQGGHVDWVAAIRARLDAVIKALEDHLSGLAMPQQTAALARLKEQVGILSDEARATTATGRLAARAREISLGRRQAAWPPSHPDDRFEVAWGLVRSVELASQVGRQDEARSSLDEALRSLEALARAEPEDLRSRQGQARCREAIARVQARAGQASEARASARNAVAIARGLAGDDGAYAYDLACALSLHARLSASKDEEDEAVAVLRRAIREGFDDGHRLRTDPRLDGLRSRPDFPAPPGTAR